MKPASKLILVDVKDFKEVASSKEELWTKLVVRGQLYLPPKQQSTLDFIRQILKRDKLVLKQKDLRYSIIPIMPELSVKRVIEKVKQNPRIL